MIHRRFRTRVQAQLLLSCSGAAFAASAGVTRARQEGFTPGMLAVAPCSFSLAFLTIC